jgi:hypothetical protein
MTANPVTGSDKRFEAPTEPKAPGSTPFMARRLWRREPCGRDDERGSTRTRLSEAPLEPRRMPPRS